MVEDFRESEPVQRRRANHSYSHHVLAPTRQRHVTQRGSAVRAEVETAPLASGQASLLHVTAARTGVVR